MKVLVEILHSDIVETLISFLNSNFILALVGLSIFILYWLQIRNQKIAAASAIFFEIKNAEKLLKKVREEIESGDLPEDVSLMQVESWSQYKYLFIKDFDTDEWESINDFYGRCKLIDDAILYNKTFFQKNEEQIRINKYRASADYAKDSVADFSLGGNVDTRGASERYKKFDEVFMKINEVYSPQKPVLDVKKNIQKVNPNLSFGSAGIKLKKLAHIKP